MRRACIAAAAGLTALAAVYVLGCMAMTKLARAAHDADAFYLRPEM